MRQIALNNKKLRGISRRVRASETSALSFKGYVRARFDETELHFNWKIPVHSALVQGSQGRLDTQSKCVAQLVNAAIYLYEASRGISNDHYRVACLITWPWLHQSEVTIFYDKFYCVGFLGKPTLLLQGGSLRSFPC